MTDPNDFTVSLQDVIAALETSVREGVEQPASVAFFFQPGAGGYDLPRAAVAVTRVTSFVPVTVSGVTRNKLVTFHPAQYRLDGNRLVWVEKDKTKLPAEGARFEVEYTYRDLPSGLTDFNPGSVAGTLLRAVAREVTLLYNQMNEAYRRAFIDEAEGAALDNVVALLGVRRNPAQKAAGRVTFFRKKAAQQSVVIQPGVTVSDQSGRVFVVTGEGGSIPSEPVREELRGKNRQLRNLAAGLAGVWPKGADESDADDLTKTDGTTRPKAVLDADDRTVRAAGPAPLPEADLVVKYMPRSVTVAVEAVNPGPDGNVNAGAIKIMPDPPPGAEGVTNEAPTVGGAAPETDEQLRERAKHALERGGNATLSAIKYAVLDVDGVSGAEVIDHGTDDSIPLGQVRVRYHGDSRVRERVSQAVELTRAAGVMAQLDEIVVVYVAGLFYLIPDGPVPAGGAAKFEAAVKDAVEALPIGAPLAARRLNSLAFNIPGIADVAEAKLTATRAGAPVPVPEPLPVARGEMVRPDKANIRAVFLVRLDWAAERFDAAGGKYVVDIQIIDENGAAASFNGFALDLQVMVRAGLKNSPDQPPERVNTFTARVTFAGGSKASLEIRKVDLTRADLTGFDPNVHKTEVEFAVAAAAYPGLAKIQKTLDVRKLFGL
ncbi:MAG TPA: baseplate J/gp47 family protein [Pyrinomonadaceae bacterium]|nr:baseplate J/gp47 family protein [Pyrinomonadaceae bacterium]